MMLIFSRPEYLILLLVIPFLIFIHIVSLVVSKKRAIKFANFEAIKRIKGVEIFSKNLTILYLNILIVVLIVFSISGAGIIREVEASESSFVLALDTSGSMAASDIEPSRFEAAKKAAEDFLKMVPEKTQIGVVSFSGSVFIEHELTEDKEEIAGALRNINLKYVGGTDILSAVTASVNMMKDEKEKVIILISDGQANINTLQDIIEYSNKNKVTIHSLGIGTREGAGDETGAVFKIAEDTLKTIAENTGGKYYSINRVEDFYSSLNELKKITNKKDVYELSFYLMISALVLIVLSFILINTRFRIFP